MSLNRRSMKKALVHDWFTVAAGAEKCVQSFASIWSDFDFFSLIDFLSPDNRRDLLGGKSARTSFVQNLPFSKFCYRNYLPLFPLAIEQFDLSEYDFILSSSHAVAKGVITRPDQFHVSYIHSPMRYAWEMSFHYLKESNLERGLKGLIARYILHRMRLWDVSTANRVDQYIANSHHIAARIRKIYNKEADVIYPPVATEHFTIGSKRDSYFITSSRMVPYKKMDLIVEAFSTTNYRLVVIGNGPDFNKIKSKAKKNIEFMGFVPTNEMVNLTQAARAFIFAAEEDFGIAPIEAQACGIPVIAFGKGASLETIIGDFPEAHFRDGNTGLFFRNQSISSLLEAVSKFEQVEDQFSAETIRLNATRFSRERFESDFKKYIDLKYKEFISK